MSIKFPKLYKAAAQLLKLASEEDINVKHILYNEKKYQYYNIKSLYAIVTKALENWDVIETLIQKSNILTEHCGLDIWRIRVIVSELVIDQKVFPNPENYTIQTVIKYEEQFKKILSKKQTKALIGSNSRSETDVAKEYLNEEDLMREYLQGDTEIVIVRFIKVNLIKGNVKSVIEKFQEDGWEKLETTSSYVDYLQQLRDLEPNSPVFIQDFHFPEVLAFPPGTELQSHELYVNGSVFFMDKASCLASFLLAPKRSSHVLDMCAAPGLKTIQLASYVTSGKVYAVEKDAGRFNTLQYMVEQSGADNVITVLRDVTRLDVDQYKHVEYILVDPSCTGSGIRRRQPSATLKARLDEKTRVEKLSGFQLTLLRFALTRFPSAKRVVYSTCSLNVEENEKVVEAALNSHYHNFDVVSVQDKLPGWQNFGSKDFQFGSKCVYCQPEIDQTNGFFVAVFERKKKKSDICGLNSENNNDKSENHFKGKKRKILEENYGVGNERLKISSHKRLKLEYNQAEKNEENEVIATKSLNKVETQRVKANGKTISLSEKKRSRKKMLKIKKKLLPQLSKHKNTKVKIKNHGLNDLVEKIDKNKCFNENSDKVSRAKLRHTRKKKLKLNFTKSNDSNIPNLSKASNDLDIQKNSEGDTTKLKKRENNHDSLQENLNESPESGNATLVKKNEKRKEETTNLNEHERAKAKNAEGRIRSFERTETSPSDRDLIDKSTNKVSSKIIETEESGQTKRKCKKNNSVKHQNTNTDEVFYIEKNSDKVGNLDESSKNIKEINSNNYENEKLGSQKQKLMKKHSLNHHEKNITCIVNGDNTFYRATFCGYDDKNIKEIPSISCKSGDGETLKKTQMKSLSSDHHQSNISDIVHYNKGFDKACIVDLSDKVTEEIYAESNDKEEKGTQKKKHKKEHSSDHHKSNITDNVQDESFDIACIVGKSDKNREEIYTEVNDREEKRTHKKKHKKKHSSDNYKIDIADHVHDGKSFDRACIVETSDKTTEEIYAETNGRGGKGTQKKKHKKAHSADRHQSNITGNDHDESFDMACVVGTSEKNIEEIYTESNDREEKETYKKKHKKNHSYKINITDHVRDDKSLDRTCIVNTSEKTTEDIYAESNDWKGKGAQKKKHKKAHSSDHHKSNITDNVHNESFDIACIVGNSDKTREEIYIEINDREEKGTHQKKHKKKHSSDDYKINVTDHVHDGKSFDSACIVETSDKTTEEIYAEPCESGGKGTQKKKHKKAHSLDHQQSNITDHVHNNKSFDSACIIETSDKTREEIYIEINDREEKGTHQKKHKKKHSSDDYKINVTDHVHDGKSFDSGCIVETSDKTTEEIYAEPCDSGGKGTQKKKHKKAHSLDHQQSNITDRVHNNNSFDSACIIETSDKTTEEIYAESNDREEIGTQKKKHKKGHSSDHQKSNITENFHDFTELLSVNTMTKI